MCAAGQASCGNLRDELDKAEAQLLATMQLLERLRHDLASCDFSPVEVALGAGPVHAYLCLLATLERIVFRASFDFGRYGVAGKTFDGRCALCSQPHCEHGTVARPGKRQPSGMPLGAQIQVRRSVRV